MNLALLFKNIQTLLTQGTAAVSVLNKQISDLTAANAQLVKDKAAIQTQLDAATVAMAAAVAAAGPVNALLPTNLQVPNV